MEYISNIIHFFDKIHLLASSINLTFEKLEEENDSSMSLLLFPTQSTIETGYFAGNKYVKSFCWYTDESDEPDSKAERILTYVDLCQFSPDNKTYYEYSLDKSKYDVGNTIKNNLPEDNFLMFVCDITHHFYTKITDKNKAYFSFIFFSKIETTESVESDDPFDPFYKKITVYYHYYPLMFYKLKEDDIPIVNLCDVNQISYLTFDNDNYDIYNVEFDTLPLENLFDEYQDWYQDDDDEDDENRFVDIEPYYNDRINQLIENYERAINNVTYAINIFGRQIRVDKSQNETNKKQCIASVILTYNDVINHSMQNTTYLHNLISENIEEIYSLMVTDILKNGVTFENILNNLEKLIEKYYMYFCVTVQQLYSDSFMYSHYNYILYDFFCRARNTIKDCLFDINDSEKVMELAENLPLISYINTYFVGLEAYQEMAQQYKSDIDNFKGGFVGGGYGIKGAAKGIFAASFANAITETAYEIYKYRKLSKNDVSKKINEFMKTSQSQKFIRELIVLDSKYLFLYLLFFFEIIVESNKLDNDAVENLGLKNFDGIFDSFEKSYKFYTIALAKQMNLEVLPLYKGMEEYYNWEPVKLVEQAILEFPYDETYYQKYVEFGGEISQNLKIYAELHLVNLDKIQRVTVNKKQNEQVPTNQNKQQFRDNQNRFNKTSEEIPIAKNEGYSRLNGKKADNLQTKIVTQFKNVLYNHEELFLELSENPLYFEYCNKHYSSHLEIVETIFEYLNNHYQGTSTSFYPVTSNNFRIKLRNLQIAYSFGNITEKNTLFFYDDTVFGGAKNGFVVTTENILIHNLFDSPCTIPIKNIKNISVKNNSVYINDKKIDIAICKLSKPEIVNILIYCVCFLLLLNDDNKSAKDTHNNSNFNNCNRESIQDSKENLQFKDVSDSNDNFQVWQCSSCYKINLPTSKYCCECGKKR